MDVPTWVWTLTVLGIIGLLLFDFFFHVRTAHVPTLREAAVWSTAYVGIAVLFGLGGVWWTTHLGTEVHYATDYLPGMLIGGAGVGFVNPALAGAATAQLPPTRLATGSAVLTMSRQIGSALGVALLVAVLGTPSPSEVVDAFQDAWAMMIGAAALAALSFVAVGPLARVDDEPLAEEIEQGLGSLAPEVVVP